MLGRGEKEEDRRADRKPPGRVWTPHYPEIIDRYEERLREFADVGGAPAIVVEPAAGSRAAGLAEIEKGYVDLLYALAS